MVVGGSLRSTNERIVKQSYSRFQRNITRFIICLVLKGKKMTQKKTESQIGTQEHRRRQRFEKPTWKAHMSDSSTDIMPPALSNSPQ